MDSTDSTQLFSNASPPVFSDNSIFFNLILGTSYENTKENCLLFLKNYSRNIIFPKREVLKILINELTLNKNSIKMLGNDEALYLMQQLIKKYSRNNIINALYEFISEKDDNFFTPIMENNLNNSSVDSSMNKLLNSKSEKDLKSGLNNISTVQESHNDDNDQSEDEEKEPNNKENKKKKNFQFLS